MQNPAAQQLIEAAQARYQPSQHDAEVIVEGDMVTLRKRLWAESFHISELPRRAAFYRGLWSRGSKVKGQPGPFASHYEGTMLALEAAMEVAR